MKCSICGADFSVTSRLTQRQATCPKCGTVNSISSVSSETVISPSRAAAARTEQALQDPEALCGRVLGDGMYRLEAFLGRGAMGYVYRAVQLNLDRTVAVKILSPSLTSDKEFVARFEREAKTLANLSHPNIVPVYDYRREGDLCYIVMELLSGPGGLPSTLADEIQSRGRLPYEDVRRIALEALDALRRAHEAGVVHRDIKPGNFLLDAAGRIRLADFGLASTTEGAGSGMTQMGTTMGTIDYMAPEQRKNAAGVDARADLYSMGMVLYELLIGTPPVFAELMSDSFLWPSRECAGVPAAIDDVVRKSLQSNREHRYASAQEMYEAIATAKQEAAHPPHSSHVVTHEQPSARIERDGHARRAVFPRWSQTVGSALFVVLLIAVGAPIIYGKQGRNTSQPLSNAGQTPPTTAPDSPKTASQPKLDSKPASISEVIKTGSAQEVDDYLAAHPDELNALDGDGRTVLHMAAMRGDAAVVMAVLNAGGNTAIGDKQGRTALHLAAQRPWSSADTQSASIVRALAEAMKKAGSTVDVLDSMGNTPLHLAAEAHNETIVDELLKLGASTMAKNTDGKTPGDLVPAGFDSLRGKLRSGLALVHADAGDAASVMKMIQENPTLVDERDGNDNTPLLMALRKCHTDVARLLISQNAHVNQLAKDRQTPLRLVLEAPCMASNLAEQVELARLLVGRGAKADWVDGENNTPLHLWAFKGDEEMVKAIAPGSNPTARNNAGQTAICLASASLHDADVRKRVLAALEKFGSRMDCSDIDGNSDLAIAAKAGELDRMIELMRQGSKPLDARNKKGETALHVAIRAKQVEAVDLLLKNNADATAADNEGNTPMHAAAEAGDMRMAELVLAKNKRFGDKNNSGKTPAQVARDLGNQPIADLFTPPPSPKASILPQNFNMIGKWHGEFRSQSGQITDFTLTVAKVGAQGTGNIQIGSGTPMELNRLYWTPDAERPSLKILSKSTGPKIILDSAVKGLGTIDGRVELQTADKFVWRLTDPPGDAILTRQP